MADAISVLARGSDRRVHLPSGVKMMTASPGESFAMAVLSGHAHGQQ